MTGIDRVLDRSDPPDPDPTAVIGSGWLAARLSATLAARRAALRAGGRWRRRRMAGAAVSSALGHNLARELDGELARTGEADGVDGEVARAGSAERHGAWRRRVVKLARVAETGVPRLTTRRRGRGGSEVVGKLKGRVDEEVQRPG